MTHDIVRGHTRRRPPFTGTILLLLLPPSSHCRYLPTFVVVYTYVPVRNTVLNKPLARYAPHTVKPQESDSTCTSTPPPPPLAALAELLWFIFFPVCNYLPLLAPPARARIYRAFQREECRKIDFALPVKHIFYIISKLSVPCLRTAASQAPTAYANL